MAATCEIINSGVLDPSDLAVPMHQLAISGQLNEQEPDVSDRDSANHSPSDFLSGNIHSDAQSEVSHDQLRKHYGNVSNPFSFLCRVPMTAEKEVLTA